MSAAKVCQWVAHPGDCTEPVTATARLEQFKGRVCASHLDRLRAVARIRGSKLNHRASRQASEAGVNTSPQSVKDGHDAQLLGLAVPAPASLTNGGDE